MSLDDLPKGFQFGYDGKSNSAFHTSSIGALISMRVLALKTPVGTSGKLVLLAAYAVVVNTAATNTSVENNILLHMVVES